MYRYISGRHLIGGSSVMARTMYFTPSFPAFNRIVVVKFGNLASQGASVLSSSKARYFGKSTERDE